MLKKTLMVAALLGALHGPAWAQNPDSPTALQQQIQETIQIQKRLACDGFRIIDTGDSKAHALPEELALAMNEYGRSVRAFAETKQDTAHPGLDEDGRLATTYLGLASSALVGMMLQGTTAADCPKR